MCVLCGELVMKVHWTDQKIHETEFSPLVKVGESQRARMRTRLQRINFSNKVLNYYGLRLSDWNGSKYILSDKKGNSVVIQDLGDMWPEAEKLVKSRLDPLDPTLIQFISTTSEGNG